MIEVRTLSKYYGDFAAVKEVSFSAAKGEIVGFLGPNGAGKTTTIRMLATFMPPSSGTALIGGYDINKEAHEVRKVIGYLPETPPLYDEMTVEEFLLFVARIKGFSGSEVRSRAEVAMEKCFVAEVRNKLCRNLSRGFRQRVGLAQAIIHDPEVVILDEPTSGLDPRQIIEIRKLISSLAQNHTVILSTHILPEVTMVCSKVVIISRGRIALEGQLSEVVKNKSLEQVFIEHAAAEYDLQQQPV